MGFGDLFKITNIAIVENKDKGQLFVSMPRYKSNERSQDGSAIYKDVCNPITAEFREELYSNILDSFGKGMREAGQKVANTFRTFADKEEVDYSDKEKKFSKTEVAKKPWQWQKKVYESMVLHLDATIDKVEDLSRDVELDRMEKKQIEKPEQVTDIRDAIAPVSSVAEPTEYQFGAETFEAA